jgi:hypothetical protein
VLDIFALVLALVACGIATSAFFFATRARACDHAAQITTIHSQVRELDADLDDVFERIKRLTSRKGMQARREEVKAGAMLPHETPDQWKARMRRAKNDGALTELEV